MGEVLHIKGINTEERHQVGTAQAIGFTTALEGMRSSYKCNPKPVAWCALLRMKSQKKLWSTFYWQDPLLWTIPRKKIFSSPEWLLILERPFLFWDHFLNLETGQFSRTWCVDKRGQQVNIWKTGLTSQKPSGNYQKARWPVKGREQGSHTDYLWENQLPKRKKRHQDTAEDHCPKYTSLSPQLGVWGSLNMAEAKMVKTTLRVALDTNLNCIYFYLKVLLTFLFKKKHTKLPEMWTGSTRRGSPLLARAPAVARGTNICETLGQAISFTNKTWPPHCRLCWYTAHPSAAMAAHRKRRRRIWSPFTEHLKALSDAPAVRLSTKHGLLVVHYAGFLLNMARSHFSYKNKIREHGAKVGFSSWLLYTENQNGIN